MCGAGFTAGGTARLTAVDSGHSGADELGARRTAVAECVTRRTAVAECSARLTAIAAGRTAAGGVPRENTVALVGSSLP